MGLSGRGGNLWRRQRLIYDQVFPRAQASRQGAGGNRNAGAHTVPAEWTDLILGKEHVVRKQIVLQESTKAALFGVLGWAVWTYLGFELVYGALKQPII